MWFTATGLSHAFWVCLASLVGTEVPERLVQMFSTEATDWSVKSLMPSGRMDCCSSSVESVIIIIILFYTPGSIDLHG